MMIVKCYVIKSQTVQSRSGEFISQQGRVAFHIGVEMLLLQQIGSDRLDLFRGTSVKR